MTDEILCLVCGLAEGHGNACSGGYWLHHVHAPAHVCATNHHEFSPNRFKAANEVVHQPEGSDACETCGHAGDAHGLGWMEGHPTEVACCDCNGLYVPILHSPVQSSPQPAPVALLPDEGAEAGHPFTAAGLDIWGWRRRALRAESAQSSLVSAARALREAIEVERRLLRLSQEQHRDLHDDVASSETWREYQIARHRVNELIGAYEAIPAAYARADFSPVEPPASSRSQS
jgi:hypothetical protein